MSTWLSTLAVERVATGARVGLVSPGRAPGGADPLRNTVEEHRQREADLGVAKCESRPG